GALATTLLTGISLVGSHPAHADDGNTYFKTEQEVFDFLNQSAPLNQYEGIKGYPANGQDSQQVKLDDVEKVSPHDQALKVVRLQVRCHGRPGHQPDQWLVRRRKGHLGTHDPRRAGQKMVLIPARVLIQAPGNPAPMTFVK